MRRRSVTICAKDDKEFLQLEVSRRERSSSLKNVSGKRKISYSSRGEENDFKLVIKSVSNLNNSIKYKDNEMFFNFLTSYTINNKKANQTSKIIQLKTFHKSLTQNRLVDLDLNETVKNIVAYDESNGYRNEKSENDNINAFIKQNIENVDEFVKVMLIGTSKVGKTSLINSFIGNTDDQDQIYRTTTGIDIQKTITRILDKNVRIEFMDTDMDIHYNVITKSLYKISNAYFYIVNSDERSLNFVKQIHNVILASTSNTSFYLFYLKGNEENESIVIKIREFCECFKISFVELKDRSDFSQKNIHLLYIFNNILMKKILMNPRSNKDSSIKKQLEMNEKVELEMKLGCNEDYLMEQYSENSINIMKRTHSDNKIILSKKN